MVASSLSASGADHEHDPTRLLSRVAVGVERRETPLRALSDPDTAEIRASKEDVREVVSRYLHVCTKDRRLPPLIARFLDLYWRPYMANLYASEGERSQAWSRALENSVKLLWSVQPKPDEKSRQRLYGLIPELFQWVHRLLDAQQMSVPDQDGFFAELAQLHAAALGARTGARNAGGGEKPGQRPPRADADRPPRSLRQAAAGERVPPQPTAVPTTLGTPRTGAQGAALDADPLVRLAVGSWVALQGERGKRVLRLEWISKGGGVYHFRDQKRGDSMCLTAARCLHLMREKAVTPLQ